MPPQVVDCHGIRDQEDSAIDSLFILRHVAGLPVTQPPQCTDIGGPAA